MSNIPQFASKNFIGIDLHSDNAQICVMNTVMDEDGHVAGKVLFNKKISLIKGHEAFIKAIEPFCKGVKHIVAVESTYNWYWMADEFEKRDWNLVLADPSTVSEDKKKATNDRTDAEFIAERLRHDNLNYTQILDRDIRHLRDLIRMRMETVKERASRKIKLINLFTNQLCIRIKSSELKMMEELYTESKTEPEKEIELMETLHGYGITNRAQMFKVMCIISELSFFSQEVTKLEEEIDAIVEEYSKSNHEIQAMASKLRTIKGCGKVLSNVIAFEIGTMARFKEAGQFASYCRLAPTSKLSNGSSKGMGNAKNGNAYLSWAFTELANLTTRFNEPIKKYYDRMFKRQKLRVKAIRTLAAKLARAVWHMLKKNEGFDLQRLFG